MLYLISSVLGGPTLAPFHQNKGKLKIVKEAFLSGDKRLGRFICLRASVSHTSMAAAPARDGLDPRSHSPQPAGGPLGIAVTFLNKGRDDSSGGMSAMQTTWRPALYAAQGLPWRVAPRPSSPGPTVLLRASRRGAAQASRTQRQSQCLSPKDVHTQAANHRTAHFNGSWRSQKRKGCLDQGWS